MAVDIYAVFNLVSVLAVLLIIVLNRKKLSSQEQQQAISRLAGGISQGGGVNGAVVAAGVLNQLHENLSDGIEPDGTKSPPNSPVSPSDSSASDDAPSADAQANTTT